ncbi:1,4-dihydroxy-6-naphthoate synthase [Parapedobacter deserti]|uniref:1,4-dihydroxy-6-naphtoate synthase n=1 Tax=Parapedobacter deserti TaxID=1912957 RepID=A0ABV7JSQ0_9SPHI
MKLTLGFSPCPNDTFIFDALIHRKIDTEGLNFDVYYEDVETLNQKAFNGELDVTKLSYHAYAFAVEDYVLLNAGSALGFGVGPLLICKQKGLAEQLAYASDQWTVSGSELKVGIPGKYTTANFLLGLAYPGLTNRHELLFSDIEQALLDERIDLGLIIHENRFTFQNKGLYQVVDLGDFWEKMASAPIPLGGIVVKRGLPDEVKHRVDTAIRRSVEYAFANPKSSIDFVRSHAQEMSEAVMYKHIELYVNRYSLALGEEGRAAIRTLFEKAWQLGLVPQTANELFLFSA